VDAFAVFIDATHIKASANKNKAKNEEIRIAAPANIYDSVMFDDLYKDVTTGFPEIEMATLDSAYSERSSKQ